MKFFLRNLNLVESKIREGKQKATTDKISSKESEFLRRSTHLFNFLFFFVKPHFSWSLISWVRLYSSCNMCNKIVLPINECPVIVPVLFEF